MMTTQSVVPEDVLGETLRILVYRGFQVADYDVVRTDKGLLPTIHISVAPERMMTESHRLVDLFLEYGISFKSMDWGAPSVQTTYVPTDNICVITVFGIDDREMFLEN